VGYFRDSKICIGVCQPLLWEVFFQIKVEWLWILIIQYLSLGNVTSDLRSTFHDYFSSNWSISSYHQGIKEHDYSFLSETSLCLKLLDEILFRYSHQMIRISFFFFFVRQALYTHTLVSRYLVLFFSLLKSFFTQVSLVYDRNDRLWLHVTIVWKNEIYAEPTLSPYKVGQWHNGGCCHATVLTKIAL